MDMVLHASPRQDPAAALMPMRIKVGRRRYSERARQEVRGDGNCFWRSLAGKRWKCIKASLKNRVGEYEHACPTAEHYNRLCCAMGKARWNNVETIQAIAHHLNIDILIYTPQPSSSRRHCTYQVKGAHSRSRQVRLVFAEGHYSALPGGLSGRRMCQEMQRHPAKRKEADGNPPCEERQPRATRRSNDVRAC